MNPPVHRQYRYYDFIMAAFVCVLLCSNLIGAAKAAQVDLPLRDDWLQARDETMANQVEAQAAGLIAAVEVYSINSSDLEVDWSQLNGLGVTEGGTNG